MNIHEVYIFPSEPSFNKEYFIEISIKISSGKCWLNTMWQPKLGNYVWYDFIIINNKIDWNAAQVPIEFINYCDIYVEKYFRLKAFS